MQKRFLGSSGIEVSAIGLGTVKFGRNQAVKYPTAFSLPSDLECETLLSLAQELGINLLDTAPAYGASEERLGKLLRGKRDEWIISTKAGEEFVDGVSHYDFTSRAIRMSVERSLQRLQTDYLDIVLVHSNGDDQRIIEEENVFLALEKLKNAGKIRAFGMSTKTTMGGLMAVDLSDIAMVTYNLNETDDREIISYAKKKQKGILIKKAFASGHAACSATESLRYVFAEEGVTSVIVGTINAEHLRENVQAFKSSCSQ